MLLFVCKSLKYVRKASSDISPDLVDLLFLKKLQNSLGDLYFNASILFYSISLYSFFFFLINFL